MTASYKYARFAQGIAEEIEAVLTQDGVRQMAKHAATKGRPAWGKQLEALHPFATELVAHAPSKWKKHPLWQDETQRQVLLCSMHMIARQGSVLLLALAQTGHRLMPGASYRQAAADAGDFVDNLFADLPDPYWSFESVPSPFEE